VGTIPDLKRVHGIAPTSDLGRGFIGDGGADEAVVFDLKTLKVPNRIENGGNPDCIIYHPASLAVAATWAAVPNMPSLMARA
jgi:hypothetical protein